jgi:hypothetical protein
MACATDRHPGAVAGFFEHLAGLVPAEMLKASVGDLCPPRGIGGSRSEVLIARLWRFGPAHVAGRDSV